MTSSIYTVVLISLVLSCVTVIYHVIASINSMSWKTSFLVWLFHALLGVGAFWTCLELFYGGRPPLGSTLVVLGLAAKYLFERRQQPRTIEAPHGSR
jgi:hypothetical protein